MPPCMIEGTRWQLDISGEYLKLYSDIVREGRKDDLTNAVNLFFPTLKTYRYLRMKLGDRNLSVITDNGTQLPLKDIGGGVVRLLKLYLSFSAVRNGMVLVDEIENGIHYSVMRDLWNRVRVWMREWDVQFVATTHSAECIEAAMEAFADEPTTYPYIISLRTSRGTSNQRPSPDRHWRAHVPLIWRFGDASEARNT